MISKDEMEEKIVRLVVESYAEPGRGNVTVRGVIDALKDTISELEYAAMMSPAKGFYE